MSPKNKHEWKKLTKLIKYDSKDIHIVTKKRVFQINAVLSTC